MEEEYKNDKPWGHQMSNESHPESDFPTRRPASTLANRRKPVKHRWSCDIQDHLPQKSICYGGPDRNSTTKHSKLFTTETCICPSTA